MNANSGKPGRPKLYRNVSECLFCWSIITPLSNQQQQYALVQENTSYCVKCFMNFIEEKMYENPLDLEIKKFYSGKIDYRELIS